MDSICEISVFDDVTDWVFDLDNTLYPRSANLFSQIDGRMNNYVARLTGLGMEEARAVQKRLYQIHGTTLRGLMNEYSIDPHAFLADVHSIDYSVLKPHPELGGAIASLPGRKHIFTNGDMTHAMNTLAALGLTSHFDAMFDIVASGFEPKPSRIAYDRFLEAHNIEPSRSAMFEDMSRNLEIPKSLGMMTVLVVPAAGSEHGAEDWEIAGHGEPHIDHVTDDLTDFVVRIAAPVLG